MGFFDNNKIPDLIGDDYGYYDIDWIPSDVTGTPAGSLMSTSLNDVLLTKGLYIFVIGNPKGNINNFSTIKDKVEIVDENGVLKNKRFEVIRSSLDIEKNELRVWVKIIDNPIPVFVIWGAVAIIVAATGAISINSVLKNIIPVLNSPVVWGIVAIFLLPLLLPLITKMKKGKT